MSTKYKKSELTGVGFVGQQGEVLSANYAAIGAAGSVLSQAITNFADVVLVSALTSASADGFGLRNIGYKRRQVVINGTSGVLKLWPPDASSTVNNQSVGTHVGVASGVAAIITQLSDTAFWVK